MRLPGDNDGININGIRNVLSVVGPVMDRIGPWRVVGRVAINAWTSRPTIVRRVSIVLPFITADMSSHLRDRRALPFGGICGTVPIPGRLVPVVLNTRTDRSSDIYRHALSMPSVEFAGAPITDRPMSVLLRLSAYPTPTEWDIETAGWMLRHEADAQHARELLAAMGLPDAARQSIEMGLEEAAMMATWLHRERAA